MSTAEQTLRRVAELDTHSALSDPDQIFGTLISVVACEVAGAESVGVVTRDSAGYSSAGATDELARRVDERQFKLGTGPCAVAIADTCAGYVPGLSDDRRWSNFTRWAHEQCLASAFSVGFAVPGAEQPAASVNRYPPRTRLLDPESIQLVSLLARFAGIALSDANCACEVADLELAVHTRSDIGTAIAVIMARYRRSRDQTRDLLRDEGQRTNRKVSDLAAGVIETRALPGHVARRERLGRRGLTETYGDHQR